MNMKLLASCTAPPPGVTPKPCHDMVYPSLFVPLLVTIATIAVVVLAGWLWQRRS